MPNFNDFMCELNGLPPNQRRVLEHILEGIYTLALDVEVLPETRDKRLSEIDNYLTKKVQRSKSEVVITTKYCHEYSRDEEALLTTRAEGAENALLFASGAQCEVISATKPEDSSFSLLDFLIQLGLMIATKGALGSPTPKAKPK